MKLLLLFGASLVLACVLPPHLEKPAQNKSEPIARHDERNLLAQNTSQLNATNLTHVSQNLTGNVSDFDVPRNSSQAGRKTHAQNSTSMRNVSTDRIGAIAQNQSSKPMLSPNSTEDMIMHNGSMKSGNLTLPNVTVTKRSLTSHLRSISGPKKQNESKQSDINETRHDRKLLQSQLQSERVRPQPLSGNEKISSLKNYESEFPDTIKNSAIYNYTELFWKDVQKWAVDPAQLECPELMAKWFSAMSVVQLNGLPTSFSMIGNNSSVCKVLKRGILPESFDWQSNFFNDLTSSAMGSVWIKGQAVTKGVQLPDQLELVFYLQFDPATFKVVQLEIVPVEPDVIFEALASKPIRSFHHIVRTAMKEGLSPAVLSLLSEQFVLEVPNLFLEKSDFKTKFTKSELKQFMDQDIKIFDFEDAKLESFSLPFYDEKSVVSEIRFDELPIESNGLVLEDMKFWITHTFDCKDDNSTKQDTKINRTAPMRQTQAVNSSRTFGSASKVPLVDSKNVKANTQSEFENFCLLERVQITINRPISLLTQIAPFESEDEEKSAKQSSVKKNISE